MAEVEEEIYGLMRLLIFIFVAVLAGACSRIAVQSEQSNESMQKPQSTPFAFPTLTKPDSEQLDERFPKKFRDLLEQSDQIELFETKLCLNGWSLGPIEPNKFQGCDIVKRARLTDSLIRHQLFDGVFYAIGSENNELACTSPIHGIRAIKGKDRLEMLICFHCHNFRGISTIGRFGGSFSSAPKELFEKLLSEP
ncbi:MAG: hypothetical protein IPO41_13550 [Acidobacteria bacterium]|nr:hypothetical protein [Acidobacteriota bacterium]